MTLSEYLIEAVASRRTGKYLLSNKKSILDWLDSNGFKRFDLGEKLTQHIIPGKYTYMVSKPFDEISKSDWISVHTPSLREIIIWFGKDGSVEEIELRYQDWIGKNIDMDEFIGIMQREVK